MNLLDDICEPGPLLTPEAVKAPMSTSHDSAVHQEAEPVLDDEQLNQVVEIFQAHGLL